MLDGDALTASGAAIGSRPVPYRLDYSLLTGSGFVTAEVNVRSRGNGWERNLTVVRSDDGRWSAHTSAAGEAPLPMPAGDTRELDNALDANLGLSPLFNTMPVLRHDLPDGFAADFLMVWISVPDLAARPSPQRYTRNCRPCLTAIASSASNRSVAARTSSLTSCSPPTVSSSD